MCWLGRTAHGSRARLAFLEDARRVFWVAADALEPCARDDVAPVDPLPALPRFRPNTISGLGRWLVAAAPGLAGAIDVPWYGGRSFRVTLGLVVKRYPDCWLYQIVRGEGPPPPRKEPR